LSADAVQQLHGTQVRLKMLHWMLVIWYC